MESKKLTAHLEPITAAFIEKLSKLNAPPLYTLSPEQARKVIDDLQSSDVKDIPVDIEERIIPHEKLGDISVYVIRPQGSTGVLPVIMFFHGAGWILGGLTTHGRLARELVQGTGAAVVFVNYTLSPEAQYPVAIEQAYAATKYISEHGKQWHLDGSRLAVFGDSVGGNMATVVTLLAKERGGPKIAYQVLFYPVTNGELTSGSYTQFADGPWLTKSAMEWFWNAYEPNKEARKKHTISPLNATLEQLKNLPPALIITDENDVLRDEGEAYAHKLMDAGVTVQSIRCLGTMHDFAMINAIAQAPAARAAISLACDNLKTALKA